MTADSMVSRFQSVNILAERAGLWITPVRGYFKIERIKSEIRILKCFKRSSKYSFHNNEFVLNIRILVIRAE